MPLTASKPKAKRKTVRHPGGRPPLPADVRRQPVLLRLSPAGRGALARAAGRLGLSQARAAELAILALDAIAHRKGWQSAVDAAGSPARAAFTMLTGARGA